MRMRTRLPPPGASTLCIGPGTFERGELGEVCLAAHAEARTEKARLGAAHRLVDPRRVAVAAQEEPLAIAPCRLHAEIAQERFGAPQVGDLVAHIKRLERAAHREMASRSLR